MEYKIFWCKVNKYYTDKWLNSNKLEDKKGIFIASCVVTDKAKRKWIKFIKDTIKDLENNSNIYISWCWAFKDWRAQSDFFILYPELEEYKNKIEILWEDPWEEEKIEKNSTPGLNLKNLPTNLYTKKFVLIQWWCDSFCTFCLTVIKRGRHFSRSKEDITKEILEFEKSWWKEVVLTWVNLSAWGLESTNTTTPPPNPQKGNIPPPNPLLPKEGEYEVYSKFHELIKYILENTNIPRIRISSMGPEFVDKKLLELFKNTRVYPHFHFSVQSGSSKILKSMARHYDWEYIKNLLIKCKNIKREDWVDISLWADIIVWFPGETDEDFMDTYDLVKEVWIQKIHAFPFSAHEMWESVPAWKFKDQVSWKIKKERMEKLTILWDKIRENFIASQKWKELKVLIEWIKDLKWKWWTQNYIQATNENFKITSGEIKRNKIVIWKVKIAEDKLLL